MKFICANCKDEADLETAVEHENGRLFCFYCDATFEDIGCACSDCTDMYVRSLK